MLLYVGQKQRVRHAPGRFIFLTAEYTPAVKFPSEKRTRATEKRRSFSAPDWHVKRITNKDGVNYRKNRAVFLKKTENTASNICRTVKKITECASKRTKKSFVFSFQKTGLDAPDTWETPVSAGKIGGDGGEMGAGMKENVLFLAKGTQLLPPVGR